MAGLLNTSGGGLFGNIGGGATAPNYTTVPLDSGTNSLINTQIGLASQSPSQFAAQANQGVGQTAAQVGQTSGQMQQEDAQMGYSNGAINSAIRGAYNSQAGGNIQRIMSGNEQTAMFQKSAQMQKAAAAALARQNVQTQSYERLMQSYNDTEQARAQILSSILGAGGMIGGYAAANKKQSPHGGTYAKSNEGNLEATNFGYGGGQGGEGNIA